MSRRTIRILLGLFAGLAMSLAAPAMAVAHGHAHAELLEHADEAHHASHAYEGVATVDADSQHDAHAHPSLEAGLSSRFVQLVPLLAAPPAVYDVVAFGDGIAAAPPAPTESPPGPLRETPAQPRAPPAPSAV